MNSTANPKRAAAHHAAELVEDGMVVGLGTGSTAFHLVERLGERVANGLSITGVPTSQRTADQASELGIPLGWVDDFDQLDLAIDGADEIDPTGQLIKGLGGALVREKIVANFSRQFVIIADQSKEVKALGAACPVPVEVTSTATAEVQRQLVALGADPKLRETDERPYVTDNGNWILDAHFGAISSPAELEVEINALDGVVDNGIFANMAHRIVIGEDHGVREWTPNRELKEGQ